MPLYLKIAVVALLIIVLFSLRKYARIKAKRRYRSTIYSAVTKPLVKVHLKPEYSPSWLRNRQVESLINDFNSVGFVPGKSYIIRELNDFQLQSMFLDNFAAMVVKHPVEGCWAEVCCQREDGKFLLVSNSPIGDEQNTHQDNEIIYQRDSNPIGLYNFLKVETAMSFTNPITEDNFKPVIEQYHLREISRKNNQGGITIKEFKNNIKRINKQFKITKSDLRKVFLEMKVDELHQWHEACIFAYRQSTDQKASKFNYLDYELFIVPRKTISQAYIEYLSDFGVIDKKLKDSLSTALRKKSDIRNIFQVINNALPDHRRATQVGHVEYPLDAEIYKRGFRLI
jgi:hypothetical protein